MSKPKPSRKLPFRPRPNRKKTKRQITARIDEELMKIVDAQDESTMTLTDIIEEGLYWWIQNKSAQRQAMVRDRFVWKAMPQELRKLTMAFWVFWGVRGLTEGEESIRRMIMQMVELYIDQPLDLASLGMSQ